MVSTFFGLNIASSGLRAANAALNTTGNNISNVNTEGYSRQTVDTAPSDALRTFTRYGSAGAGVDTLAIERVRDQFYDNRFRQNETLLGEYELKNYFNNNIQTYLKDDGDTGFSSLFDKMQAALQTAMKNSGSNTTVTTYVSQVQAVTEYFNGMYQSLQREQADANDELKIRVSKINSIAQELATINQRINQIEMTGTTANELRDKRDKMIDELSKIVSVETRETDVIDDSQPDRKTGATRFEVYIAGGQSLVDAAEYKQLLCVARSGDDKVNQNDVEGLYDVRWIHSNFDPKNPAYIGDFDLGNPHIGGELGGIVAMRDGNNGQDFHGYVNYVDYENRLVTVRTDEFEDYLKSLDKCTLPESGQITVDNTRYQYDSWAYREIRDEKDQAVGWEYVFHLKSDVTDGTMYDTGLPVEANEMKTCGYAQVGPDIEYQGIPYYLQQMNEFARLYSGEVNDILHSGYPAKRQENGISLLTGNRNTGSTRENPQYSDDEVMLEMYKYDADGNKIIDSVTNRPVCGANKVEIEIDDLRTALANKTITQDEFNKLVRERSDANDPSKAASYAALTAAEFNDLKEIKGQMRLTAGNFTVSSSIKADTSLLATRLDKTEGLDECRALDAIYKMSSTKEIFRGATSGEFLDKVLGDVALNASNTQTNEDTYASLRTTIENQRQSVMGVDEDEEAANLVKYQNSYTLASKMIQTLTEIYDRLINQTGV
ncbi:MAG: flagellar hook-associated protein FlgK [Lachnospiraceae bacterium]|nr:flagellar hook-associated protein FlgK [Lachnospiraceae bacterium]